MRALAVPAFLLVAACEVTPNYVDKKDVDDAFARSAFKTMCVGLDMKDDDVRRYTAERLLNVDDPISGECLCAALSDEKTGWDAAVAAGIKGTDRDQLATCFAEIVKKPDLPERLEAVVALANVPAAPARQALAEIATSPGDSAVRAKAVEAIGGDVTFREQLFKLVEESDVAVRSAAVIGVASLKDDKDAAEVLKKLASSDPEGDVRASAMVGLRKVLKNDADPILCEAMISDSEPSVRRSAVGSFRGTKRPEAVACLRKKALTLEEDASVRSEVLAVLKSSPSDDAAKVLCDAIPFWMKSYLKEAASDKVPGTNIIEVQNDRDWQRSYECLQKARGGSGYSCYGRMEVGWWFNKVGGNVHVTACPGYESEPE